MNMLRPRPVVLNPNCSETCIFEKKISTAHNWEFFGKFECIKPFKVEKKLIHDPFEIFHYPSVEKRCSRGSWHCQPMTHGWTKLSRDIFEQNFATKTVWKAVCLEKDMFAVLQTITCHLVNTSILPNVTWRPDGVYILPNCITYYLNGPRYVNDSRITKC